LVFSVTAPGNLGSNLVFSFGGVSLVGSHVGQPTPPQQKAVFGSGLPNIIDIPLDEVSDHLDGNSEAETMR
jgi:hypothetical protein